MMKKLLLTLSLVLLLFIVQSCRLSSAVFNGRSDTPDNREGERLWTKARTHFKSGHCDSVIVYAKRAAKIFATNEYYSGLLECYNLISECYLMNCEYEKVIELNGGIKPTGNKKNSTDFIDAYIVSQIQLANAYNYMLKYDAAEACLQEAIEIHRSCENCRKHLSGELLHHMGLLYYSKEKYGLSIDYYNKAISFFQQDTTRERELAKSCQYLGRAYLKMSKLDSAENCFKIALCIYERKGGNSGLFSLYNDFASYYKTKGNYEKAIHYCHRILDSVYCQLGENSYEKGRAYNLLAAIKLDYKDFNAGLEFLRKSNEIFKQFPNKSFYDVLFLNNTKAGIYFHLGKYQSSIEILQKSKKILEKNSLFGHSLYGDLSINLSKSFSYLADFEKVEESSKKAFDIFFKVFGEDHPAFGNSCLFLGHYFMYCGDLEQALTYYKRARDIMQRSYDPNHYDNAIIAVNLGNIYYLKLQYRKSLECYQDAIKIVKYKFGSDHLTIPILYTKISRAYNDLGNHELALEYSKRSVALQDSLLDTITVDFVFSLTSLGDVYFSKGDYQNAFLVYERAINDMNKKGTQHWQNVYLYSKLGNLKRAEKQFETALDYYQQSLIHASEHFTNSNWTANPEIDDILYKSRVLKGFLGKSKALLELYVKQADPQILITALQTIQISIDLFEKLRSSYYLEESKIDFSIGFRDFLAVALKISLKLFELTNDAQYKELAFKFSEKNKYGILSEALNEIDASGFSPIPDSLLKKEKILRLEAVHGQSQLNQKLKADNAADSSLIHYYRDKVFSAKRSFQLLRDQIEKDYPKYFAARYHVDTVTPVQVQHVLDDSTVMLEYFISDTSLYTFVLTDSEYYVNETPAPPESLVQALNLAIYNTNKSEYMDLAFKLYTYLISHIEKNIDGKDVVIIPSGYLHYVPFDALLYQKANNSDITFDHLPYLLEKCKLRYYFSATLFYREASRDYKSTFDKDFVAFAPVHFQGKRDSSQHRGNTSINTELNSLLQTEKELEEISSLFQKKGYNSNAYLYSDATKENFISNSKRSSFLHLATHANIDNQDIEKSWIAFSDTGSESFLWVGELYGLNLVSDLVVLSSCNSGQGEYKHGEGLVGFTRGFVYSGAKNVVVTLWEVDDHSTLEFMQFFYGAILSGKDYARALWEAKQGMIQHMDYADPYFWAPFVLMGTNGHLNMGKN